MDFPTVKKEFASAQSLKAYKKEFLLVSNKKKKDIKKQ